MVLPLSSSVYDVGRVRSVHATNQCRVVFDANRYSVPYEYASCRLNLRAYPDRLVFYHQEKLIAEHPRCYDRHQDEENPAPVRELLRQKRRACLGSSPQTPSDSTTVQFAGQYRAVATVYATAGIRS